MRCRNCRELIERFADGAGWTHAATGEAECALRFHAEPEPARDCPVCGAAMRTSDATAYGVCARRDHGHDTHREALSPF